jgi:hypothetical protein
VRRFYLDKLIDVTTCGGCGCRVAGLVAMPAWEERPQPHCLRCADLEITSWDLECDTAPSDQLGEMAVYVEAAP